MVNHKKYRCLVKVLGWLHTDCVNNHQLLEAAENLETFIIAPIRKSVMDFDQNGLIILNKRDIGNGKLPAVTCPRLKHLLFGRDITPDEDFILRNRCSLQTLFLGKK